MQSLTSKITIHCYSEEARPFTAVLFYNRNLEYAKVEYSPNFSAQFIKHFMSSNTVRNGTKCLVFLNQNLVITHPVTSAN